MPMAENNQYHPFPRTTIFLLRHGEIETGDVRKFVGQRDLPLTEAGFEQARIWQRGLAHIQFDRIYTSDLPRCKDTANIMAAKRSTGVQEVPELREINLGRWQGVAVDEIQRLYPEEYDRRGRDIANFRPPGGEAFSDLSARVVPVFEQITEGLAGSVLIVCHSGVIRVILCRVLGLPLSSLLSLELDYGSLSIVQRAGEYFRLYAMNIPPAEGSVPPVNWPNSTM